MQGSIERPVLEATARSKPARTHRWNIALPHPLAGELAERLKVSHILAQTLLGRGISDPQDCRAFLHPELKMLHDPGSLPGIHRAAERIAGAIGAGEPIVIYGDYDVDGITATAILWHAIKLLGGVVSYYVPHRIDEGYGLNAAAVEQLIDQGAKLIVTVDCGVTAVEAAHVARNRGVDLIITDHHDWREGQIPDCLAIVHPRLGADGIPPYPNPHICGAGVAFKLAWQTALVQTGNVRVTPEFRAFLLEAMALAALGTIADVVPLLGENRVLAHFGLTGLKSSKLIGIRALIASAALTGQTLDSYHVGFCLAPRLNACGRMGHARLAVKMLTEAGEAEANEIADYLETQNRARQGLERTIVQQAIAQLEARGFSTDKDRAIVLAGDDWHPGVIGIVAARLVDRYCCPVVLVAMAEHQGQGSARSIAGFHLAGALAACAQHLVAHGGHEMAAGLKVERGKFDAFREAFCSFAREHVAGEMMIPELKLEAAVGLGEMTEALVNDLHRLGPFGHGNRKPLLCFRDVRVAGSPRVVGKNGEHLQLMVMQGGARMKCIAFRQGTLANQLKPGTTVELAAEPAINEFNGRRSVELEIKELRIAK
ncbi:MAG: single-stranded-DNA-specific exonuclease RecJ [Tepidisphaeraceae bacterium]